MSKQAIKTQHVKCLSVRELYNMAISGQPINSHYHKLFDAPDCDLDDDASIMCPDNDDFIDIAQARADMELQKIVNRDNSNVNKNDVHPAEISPHGDLDQKSDIPQPIDIEGVSQNVKS